MSFTVFKGSEALRAVLPLTGAQWYKIHKPYGKVSLFAFFLKIGIAYGNSIQLPLS